MALRCGHDAGFSLTFTPDWNAYLRGKKTSPIAALMMPNIDEFDQAMHAWETACQANAFPGMSDAHRRPQPRVPHGRNGKTS